ncbi:uncharacterized protein TNCV_3154361 [Trichonephila clavipes]|nr:uncharacterized protein TNCV_3154361 [Trichonephila clavipes]
MRDFFEIFVYTTIKIVKRTVWILQVTGILQILEEMSLLTVDKSVQTDIPSNKSGQNTYFKQMKIDKFHSSPIQKNPICNLQLSFSPVKLNGKYEQTSFLNESSDLSEERNSPAVLKLEAEFTNTTACRPSSCNNSPVCDINVSLSPRVKTKYTQVNTEECVSRDGNFLKKKWNEWKSKQSVIPNPHGKFTEILNCLKKANISRYIYNSKEILQRIKEPNSPETFGCCNILMSTVKSKFQKKTNYTTVSYSRF